MECKKCNSRDLTILNEETRLITDYYTGEHYKETIIYFECNECGCEFEEVI